MNDAQTTSIVLVGVGGQGILLASEIISQAALALGYQVKTNEVHGMAQRGGSVMAQIRYGREVHSPLVAEGTARILGSFEAIEAIRVAHYLAPDGCAVVSSQVIIPVTVSSGTARYPEDVEARLRQVFPRLQLFRRGGHRRRAGHGESGQRSAARRHVQPAGTADGSLATGDCPLRAGKIP